jgi:hypothetical protein
MTQLVRFDLEDGRSLLVEVDDDEPGIERASRLNDLAVQASVSLQSALEDVRSAANVAIEKLQSLAQEPDEVEIEFGIRLNAQAGAVIAKTEAEGHLKVRITWKKSG